MVQDSEWLEENLRVFEAAATVEADKFHIVDPVLGLYAQMLLNAHRAGQNYHQTGDELEMNSVQI